VKIKKSHSDTLRNILEIVAGGVATSLITALIVRRLSPFQTQTVPVPSSGSVSCVGITTTSSVTNSHTHTVCIPTADHVTPPSSGATYQTSITNGHNHSVVMTAAQLQAANTIVTSTVSAGHTHDFNFTVVPHTYNLVVDGTTQAVPMSVGDVLYIGASLGNTLASANLTSGASVTLGTFSPIAQTVSAVSPGSATVVATDSTGQSSTFNITVS
jgi:hypothetical protein